MKQTLLILMAVALVGCKTTGRHQWQAPRPLTKEKSAKVIEAEIRRQLEKPKGELTKADFEKVTKMYLNGYELTSVKGLEKLTQLTELYLMGNNLSDYKSLEKLTQLKVLYLGQNQLTEVPKELEKLTKLTRLELEYNQLTSVKGLENLTQLTFLDLGKNQLTDVKGLEKLTKLTYLDLHNNWAIWTTAQSPSRNPALWAQIDALKKALPKCEIVPIQRGIRR